MRMKRIGVGRRGAYLLFRTENLVPRFDCSNKRECRGCGEHDCSSKVYNRVPNDFVAEDNG